MVCSVLCCALVTVPLAVSVLGLPLLFPGQNLSVESGFNPVPASLLCEAFVMIVQRAGVRMLSAGSR